VTQDVKPAPIAVAGVLSNMQQFFDSLRTNLESLEQLPHDEREVLLGQQMATTAGICTCSLLCYPTNSFKSW
jgi:hypothetical protein